MSKRVRIKASRGRKAHYRTLDTAQAKSFYRKKNRVRKQTFKQQDVIPDMQGAIAQMIGRRHANNGKAARTVRQGMKRAGA